MIIDLPTKFYYEKDGSRSFVDNKILYCENNVSFDRLMYHITYELRGKSACYYCGCELNEENRTLDHMYPRDFGGVSITNNLVPCCTNCNQKKNNLTLSEYFDYMNVQDAKKRKQYKMEVLRKHEEYRYKNGFYLPEDWYEYTSDIIHAEILLTKEYKHGKKYNFTQNFYAKYGYLPRPVVKSANDQVVDGFSVLLFAMEHHIELIPSMLLENVINTS